MTVSQRARRLLVRAYPRWWRDRYGDEFAATLCDLGMSAACLANVMRGSVDARIGGDPRASQESRGRAALAASLWTTAALAPVVLVLSRLADTRDVSSALAAADTRPAVWPALALAAVGITGAGLACLATAAVVAPAAVKAVFKQHQRDLVGPLVLIGLALALLVAGEVTLGVASSGLTYAQRNGPGPIATTWRIALPVVLAVWMIAIVIATAGASRLIRRAPLADPHAPRGLALMLAGCTTCAIAGTACWGVTVLWQTSAAFDTSTTLTWLLLLTLATPPQARALILLQRSRRPTATHLEAPQAPRAPFEKRT
jgi:hypothetical protein